MYTRKPTPEDLSYVLITAAHNEEKFIGLTLDSVVFQYHLPRKWVIVSDGSTDGTDRIVQNYASKHRFIDFVRREQSLKEKGFVSKVLALREACGRLAQEDFGFIGILDADISIVPDYYREVLLRFRQNPKLGIAGGFIHEPDRWGRVRNRAFNSTHSVAGAIQLFRKECFLSVGGFIPIPYGGEDAAAETLARMHGWEVHAYPELYAFHHKPGIKSRGLWGERFRQGCMDYVLGYHPLFETIKCIRRVSERPYFLSAALRLFGYLYSHLRREKKALPTDAERYLRTTQVQQLARLFRIDGRWGVSLSRD